MNTKQKELAEILYSHINEEQKTLCEPVIDYLLELGYSMKKYKNSQTPFALQFEKSGNVMTRIGCSKQSQSGFVFLLKYNASNEYSDKFQKPLRNIVQSYQDKTSDTKRTHFPVSPVCGACTVCNGKPRYYNFTNIDGQALTHCAGFMMSMADLTVDDVPEIKRHIENQDKYFAV
ncbi:MAG: hypothetical protein FWE06_09975 [Oscillospiraceae bacterium]|nr:hypothetical protein [Oscillospiraceae bacterium]